MNISKVKLLYKYPEGQTEWVDYENVTAIQVNHIAEDSITVITYMVGDYKKTATFYTEDVISLHCY